MGKARTNAPAAYTISQQHEFFMRSTGSLCSLSSFSSYLTWRSARDPVSGGYAMKRSRMSRATRSFFQVRNSQVPALSSAFKHGDFEKAATLLGQGVRPDTRSGCQSLAVSAMHMFDPDLLRLAPEVNAEDREDFGVQWSLPELIELQDLILLGEQDLRRFVACTEILDIYGVQTITETLTLVQKQQIKLAMRKQDPDALRAILDIFAGSKGLDAMPWTLEELTIDPYTWITLGEQGFCNFVSCIDVLETYGTPTDIATSQRVKKQQSEQAMRKLYPGALRAVLDSLSRSAGLDNMAATCQKLYDVVPTFIDCSKDASKRLIECMRILRSHGAEPDLKAALVALRLRRCPARDEFLGALDSKTMKDSHSDLVPLEDKSLAIQTSLREACDNLDSPAINFLLEYDTGVDAKFPTHWLSIFRLLDVFIDSGLPQDSLETSIGVLITHGAEINSKRRPDFATGLEYLARKWQNDTEPKQNYHWNDRRERICSAASVLIQHGADIRHECSAGQLGRPRDRPLFHSCCRVRELLMEVDPVLAEQVSLCREFKTMGNGYCFDPR